MDVNVSDVVYYACFRHDNTQVYYNGLVRTISQYTKFNRTLPIDAMVRSEYTVRLYNNYLYWVKSRNGFSGTVTPKQELEILDCIIGAKLCY